jgi:Winged helix-turn helix
MLCAMKPPLYIRHVTDDERAALEAGLHSRDAFAVRRCQILLASAERQKPSRIAQTLRCAPQTVRNVLHAFDARGLACVQRGSNVPITVEPVLNAEKRERLRAILHQSPRTFGQPASVWTLKRLAAVCHEQGLSDTTLSGPTMLDAIARLGVRWQRAKHWIVSPDPAYTRKKTPRPPGPDGRHPSGHRAGLRR